MNKRLLFTFLACFTAVGLLTACGNTVQEQNESTTPQSSTAAQETQENMQNNEQTIPTIPFKVEGNVSTDRSEIENKLEEKPKKNFFETVVDIVTGWFGGGEASKEEGKAEETTPTSKPGNQIQGTTEPTYENTDVMENTTTTEPTVAETTQGTTTEKSTLTYEEYLALSPAEKMAYYESFGDPGAFTLWFQAAKEAYNNGTAIEIGSGSAYLTP